MTPHPKPPPDPATLDPPEANLASLAGRIEATTRTLIATCRAEGYRLTGDHRVSEPTAARLLGKSASGLRLARYEGRAPPAYVLSGQISYRLRDIAAHIEQGREGF